VTPVPGGCAKHCSRESMPPGKPKPSRDAEHRLIVRTLCGVMLGRRSAVTEVPAVDAVDVADQPAGKGRPTPKRAVARKARRNVTPKTRKEAATLQRERGRAERKLARQALITGDERHLPPRDAGPVKRLARDAVDSGFSFGQVLFPLIFVVFALGIVTARDRVLSDITTYLAFGSLALMVADCVRVGRRAKFAVLTKFGPDEVRGVAIYAFTRAFLPRRFRRPPPRVTRGAQIF
jgi:hypothetical protein